MLKISLSALVIWTLRLKNKLSKVDWRNRLFNAFRRGNNHLWCLLRWHFFFLFRRHIENRFLIFYILESRCWVQIKREVVWILLFSLEWIPRTINLRKVKLKAVLMINFVKFIHLFYLAIHHPYFLRIWQHRLAVVLVRVHYYKPSGPILIFCNILVCKIEVLFNLSRMQLNLQIKRAVFLFLHFKTLHQLRNVALDSNWLFSWK